MQDLYIKYTIEILTDICGAAITTFTVLVSPAVISDSLSKFISLIFATGTVEF